MSQAAQIAVRCEEPARSFLWRLLVRQSRIAANDLRNIPRYVLRALIGVTALCGLLSLWGFHGDGAIPGISPLSGLDPYRISSAHCVVDETTVEARWSGLAPALAILDRVNPAVAKWVREKHDDGLLVFGEKYDDRVAALAKYDMLRGRVVVNRELFCENDGTIAVTLCHEYRHSRQNLGKSCQYVLSFLVVRGGDSSIIENDAVIYEQAAHNAIFGNGESNEKKLAAWEQSVQLQTDRHRVSATSACVSAPRRNDLCGIARRRAARSDQAATHGIDRARYGSVSVCERPHPSCLSIEPIIAPAKYRERRWCAG
jgi:hypothetical protein